MLYLIDKIDANLLETVVFKYLKSSDIENSAKVYFLHLGINEGFIALLDEPLEEPVVDGPGYAASCICCLQLIFFMASASLYTKAPYRRGELADKFTCSTF